MADRTLLAFSAVILSVIVTVSIINSRKTARWLGINMDLPLYMVKPKVLCNSVVLCMWSERPTGSSVIRMVSSIYHISSIPSPLNFLNTGFKSLVNTLGALDRPFGRPTNSYKLPLFWNRKYFLCCLQTGTE